MVHQESVVGHARRRRHARLSAAAGELTSAHKHENKHINEVCLDDQHTKTEFVHLIFN
jgi:hypothetical protein